MKKIALCMLFLVLSANAAFGYILLSGKWKDKTALFYVGYDSGTYDSAFKEALDSWNNLSAFKYTYVSEYADPCTQDYINGFALSDTHCSQPWDSATLAVTRTWYNKNEMIEADIIVNTGIDWAVFYGPGNRIAYDFRRVVAHELGHALGIDHSDTTNALMYYRYQDEVYTQQEDDINALTALYGSSNATTCSYSISSTSTHFDYYGGTGSVNVYANDQSCQWSANTSNAWLALGSQTSTTGNGSISYYVSTNNTSAQRTGYINIADLTFIVTQDNSTTSATKSPVYRFYNEVNATHFYTISETEYSDITATLPHYKYEGISFYAYTKKENNTSAVYRFYNTKTSAHFYTISKDEKTTIVNNMPDYTYEGVSFYAFKSYTTGTYPVYRFYNIDTNTHFYTISNIEKENIIKTLPRYMYEGIAYYTFTSQ
ncbi:MAG: matrixin family metalloprotease [Candidatus Magnetoovum sp. WYHC-5]|nr:matrixin family metalloprotease [Candidatus Magnetoovum sp. WYHC-5]